MKKINTYNSFRKVSESWEDDEEINDDEYDYGDYGDESESPEGEESSDFDSEMVYLCNTIKSLYDNVDLSVDIDYDGLNITVFTFLEKKEKLRNITKSFEMATKLKKDILPQYDSEFELYENEEGYPILCFEFTFSDMSEEPDGTKDDSDFDKYSMSGARIF